MPDGWAIAWEPSGWAVYEDRAWVAVEQDFYDALAVVQRGGAETYTLIEQDGYETQYRSTEAAIVDS